MNVGSRYYPLPQEAENVASMMRNDLLACEFVRDSFMRVGIESLKDNGGLQIELPGSRGSFFMSNLPTFKLFEYKVIPKSDGSIQGKCVSDFSPERVRCGEDQSSPRILICRTPFESREVP